MSFGMRVRYYLEGGLIITLVILIWLLLLVTGGFTEEKEWV